MERPGRLSRGRLDAKLGAPVGHDICRHDHQRNACLPHGRPHPEGLYTELVLAPDLVTCSSAPSTWFRNGADGIHLNVGKAPGPSDIAVIRGFHGALFLNHAHDLYLENIHCQGGITGALHCDAIATRNIVGVNCSFHYSSPSTSAPVPLDAVQIRRTGGLVAFFDCDASGGANDGWNFHEDGNPQMNVLVVNCTSFRNGALGATSVNAVTTHDGVRAAVLGGQFGFSANGTETHCIEATKSWLLGVRATARDPDGTSTGFKCSNASKMWLEDTLADAAGGTENHGIEANDGGQVFARRHFNIAGDDHPTNGGVISAF